MVPSVREYADQTLSGIDCCLENRLVVSGLTLLYAAIDVFGFLASSTKYAERKSFTDWCEQYLDGFLKMKGLTGFDLYSARCGVLHTAQAPSKSVAEGNARELWYRFDRFTHVNIMTDTPKPAVLIDVEEMVQFFRAGIERFILCVDANPALKTSATEKADRFFRAGIMLQAF